jgi:hypothetical protein
MIRVDGAKEIFRSMRTLLFSAFRPFSLPGPFDPLRRAAWTALLLFATAGTSAAQTPQKIVDEYVRAEGGPKALERIASASFAGSLEDTASGETGTYSLILKSPNKIYSEIIAGSRRDVVAFNGMSAWGEDASSGPHTLTGGESVAAAAMGRYLNGRLANAKKDKIGLRFVGTQDVRGHSAYRLNLLLAPGVGREVFFDAQTHLVVREIVSGPAKDASAPERASEQYDYDDYRPVHGILEPYRVTLRRGEHTYVISATRVELNAPVHDSVFDFPRDANRPLPDIPALLRDVNKNQDAVEEIEKQYTCHLSEEGDKTDSKTQATTREVKEYDVFYIGGEEVRHLLEKDGKPLGVDEKKREDDRFSKKFDEMKKKQVELANDPKKQAKQEEKEEAAISDFLRALRFTNPRRERFRGQDVIVFDFGPNPDYKPKKLVETILQKLVGVIWVDEEARDIARLEAQFIDNVRIAGGLLASLQKGSNIVIEQTRMNNEVWLPSYAEVHIAGRFLFFRARANTIDRYTDYKKFQVETRIRPADPN